MSLGRVGIGDAGIQQDCPKHACLRRRPCIRHLHFGTVGVAAVVDIRVALRLELRDRVLSQARSRRAVLNNHRDQIGARRFRPLSPASRRRHGRLSGLT